MNGRPEPPEVGEKAADPGADLAAALAGLTATPEARQQLPGFQWKWNRTSLPSSNFRKVYFENYESQ